MSLEEVSDKFIEISGRPDLVPNQGLAVDSYWYINEAQRLLDRRLNEGKIAARYMTDVVAGTILVPMYGCRAVKKVFISSSDTRTEIDKVDIQTLRENYPEPKANLDSGRPLFYSPIWAKPYPIDLDAADITYSWVMEELLTVNQRTTYNAILLLPPADVTYTIDIWGLWYTPNLSLDDDTSYWTEEHENILLNSALYILEGHYRNVEGSKGWKGFIDTELAEIVKDQIEEEVTEINQMRG